MGDLKIPVTIPLDKEGMIGRECLECEQYFKLKPGTGIETDHCHCPYCDYEGKANTFWTKAQLEYAESVAMQQAVNQIVNPSLKKLTNSFKQLERESQNSLIQFKVRTTENKISFPIKYYTENELETRMTCDNCELEFAIYGVFSKCPDCNEINAFLIYAKSLEVIRKKLDIFSKPDIPKDIVEYSLGSILSSAVSAIDGLGKELRKRKSERYPAKARNLFQNLSLLDENLGNYISDRHSNFNELLKYFQIRHIYEHNMGVVDKDFVKNIPDHSSLIGRKYVLRTDELYVFLDSMKELGEIIKEHFEK